MAKWVTMLSSAYRCQRVICVTLRIAIPLSLVVGILLGVFITMEPNYHSLPVHYQIPHDGERIRDKTSSVFPPKIITNPMLLSSTAAVNSSEKTWTVADDTPQQDLPLLMPFGHKVLSTNLTDLRIYIYPFPKGFNKNLADCAVRNARSGMCFDITNQGKGALLKTDFLHGYSVYNTHQFSLEVLFHQKLLQSKFVTWDPAEADLFYVPYYVCMRCFCPAQGGEVMNREFWDLLLHNFTYLTEGRPHFMALGKVEQEMSSKNCPFLQSPNSGRLKYLLIEQTASIRTRRFFKRLGKESEVEVVPYPSYIHFERPLAVIGDQHQDMVNLHDDTNVTESIHSDRSIHVLMIGSLKHSSLRKVLTEQLTNSSRGYAHVISPSQCALSSKESPMRIVKLMQNAMFCLQPSGDTPTRKSFYDSLLSGCVPVTFHSGVVYPFMDIFDYSSFSVNIPEEEILMRNRSIFSILDTIPKSRLISMQQTISKVAAYFQYGTYRTGHDAFTTALKKLVHSFYLKKFTTQENRHPEAKMDKRPTR